MTSTRVPLAIHPCAQHIDTCDHCRSCDELGVCCATTPALNVIAPVLTNLDILREAINDDADTQPSLTDLIRCNQTTSAVQRLIEDAEARTSQRPSSSQTRLPMEPLTLTPARSIPICPLITKEELDHVQTARNFR